MTPEELLAFARQVEAIIRRRGVRPMIVGGIAMAAHKVFRATKDLDLGVATPPSNLERIARDLEDAGFDVQLQRPASDDRLGGVIVVRRGGLRVEVVNYDNSPAYGFPKAIEDGLAAITQDELQAIPLPQLVALKVYASNLEVGGQGSRRDVWMLLQNNPDADWEAIWDTCRRYRLPVDAFRALMEREAPEEFEGDESP